LKNEINNNFKPTWNERAGQLLNEFKVNKENKISNEILVALTKNIEQGFDSNSKIEKGDLMHHVNHFYDFEGKAERNKDTCFLMIYSSSKKLIVNFYVILISLFFGDIDLGAEESGF